MPHTFLILVSALVLTACTSVYVSPENGHVRGLDMAEANLMKVAGDNMKQVEKAYRDEWRYNRRDQNRPPQLCLAMSGGGMRSAAFNIGVLKGLHRAGLLDQVDVMSSVSGGGYALSWFYLQQASTGAQLKELFDDDGRFQQYLSNHSNLAYAYPDSPLRWFSYVWEAGKWLPSTLAHVVANGLFDWRANLNPLRRTYENAIERIFHVSPVSVEPERDGFVNQAGFFSASAVNPEQAITFPEVRKVIEDLKLPFFVINTTVDIDDDPEHYGSEFAKTIYEFTPLWHGSDVFKKRFIEFPFSVSRAVAVSGAAHDSAITPGEKRQILVSTTNFDLGYNIDNPNSRISDAKHIFARVLPFPFYLAIQNYRDANGTDIYLTDGGHSDNLATFSLVRRMCGEIIVVDAEHDPEFKFQGLQRLQKRLLAEMGAGFNFHDLDITKPFDQTRPVRSGTIGSFPLQYSETRRQNRTIAVKYLKLSVDQNRLDQQGRHDPYSAAVREYATPGKKGAENNGFPQQSTADINYSRGQFLAYRDLGADMVQTYLKPLMRATRAPQDAHVRREPLAQ